MINLQNLRAALGAIIVTVLISAPAYALDLDAAKSQGLIGETATGYLAVVKSSADARALVRDVNGKRKVHYEKIARKNKISLEAVEVRAGQKAIAKTAAGHYINTGSGWQKK